MFWTVTQSLLEGFGTTLELFGLTLLFAIPLGLVIAFCSMSKFIPIKFLSKTLVWIIRGTPLMLQLIVVFYGPDLIAEWAKDINSDFFIIEWLTTLTALDRFPSVLVAFVLNYACYFSEIYRGGIESIPKGQYEACQVLGMTKTQTFFKVILFQVIKRIVPPMGNEIITLVKDTSLARTIAVYEVIWNAQKFIKLEGLLWPLLYAGVFYLVFSGILTVLFAQIEKRIDYFKN